MDRHVIQLTTTAVALVFASGLGIFSSASAAGISAGGNSALQSGAEGGYPVLTPRTPLDRMSRPVDLEADQTHARGDGASKNSDIDDELQTDRDRYNGRLSLEEINRMYDEL